MAALAVTLLVSSASADPVVQDGESAPAKAWREAMEAGDATTMAGMYDATSVTFPPKQAEVVGATAIMAGYRELFAHYRISVSVADAHWIAQPPLVVSWGITTLTLHPRSGGADIIARARFTDAAVARGGRWVYVIDHASAVPGGQ